MGWFSQVVVFLLECLMEVYLYCRAALEVKTGDALFWGAAVRQEKDRCGKYF